ncbi:aromatic ring-hydroxylating oxygenase subunit alpha [Emcibacter sp.]|uniref:aromatic ring-hydroxylating oxygenase subunit alpha n=1 Tax=Emcibacter sp. TaxID=1979954 RepID=UPI003A94A407
MKSRYGIDPRVDPEAGPDSPDRKFPDIEYETRIHDDHEKYFSDECRRLEWDRLWTKIWHIAGRTSDLQKPGDYFTYELGPESFIVVKTGDGEIKAYYNVCHHRGNRLAMDNYGNVKAFVCAFHSWSWNLDGSLRRITDRETFDEKLVCDNPGLTEVKCGVWGGFVFISMNDDVEPLMDFLGELPEVLDAYDMDNMILAADLETDWPVNWKTVLDAFMEGYHAHIRHPELLNMIDDFHFQHDLFKNGHSRMIIPMGLVSPRYPNRDKLGEEMRDLVRSFGMDEKKYENNASSVRADTPAWKREWAQKNGMDYSRFTDSQLADDWNMHIFPNITLNAHPEGVLVMRFRPHASDPERCLYDFWVLARKVSDPDYYLPTYMGVPKGADLTGNAPRPERAYGKWGEITFGPVVDQDAETVPFVQKGLHSRAFKGVRFSEQEIRLVHMYAEYDRYMKEK